MVILKKDTEGPDKSEICLSTCIRNRTAVFSSEAYGAAVDIGTTTVAVSVYSMSEKDFGKPVGSVSEENLQRRFGSDVMTRLAYCLEGMEDELSRTVVFQIERLILGLLPGISPNKVKCIAVTGNTTMCHIFLNADVKGIAGSPFRPAYEGPVSVRSEDIGMKDITGAEIYVMSGIASHVGADALAVMCDTGLAESDPGISAEAVDIGTNAEVIFKHGKSIYAASAAAGPAFEGACMHNGMKAGPGAVTAARFIPASGSILIKAVPDADGRIRVRGICAAGYIDIIYGLVRAGIIKRDGRLISREEAEKNVYSGKYADRIVYLDGQNAFTLLNENDVSQDKILLYNDNGSDDEKKEIKAEKKGILLTQKDIRAFQEAKAAVYAGLDILRITAGVKRDDIKRVYVAGMLGTAVNKKECIDIKMLPYEDSSIYVPVGNSALRGCARVLLDRDFRRYTEFTAKRCTHIELADSEAFKRLFISAFALR